MDGAEAGPQQTSQHQVVGADHGGVGGHADALVLQGAHQQHRVLVVVREDGVEAECVPTGGQPGGGPLVVGEGQFGDGGVGVAHRAAGTGQAWRREDFQAVLRGHDDADPAASAVVEVADRAVADDRVVHEQGVRALDGLVAEGDDRAGARAFEDLHPAWARSGAWYEYGDRAQFRPGTGRLVAAQADAAVLHDGVVEAAEGSLEFVEEAAVEGAAGKDGAGIRTVRLCPARRERAAAWGT